MAENEWLNEGGDVQSIGATLGAKREVCKPDYDGMIKAINNQTGLISNLYNAVRSAVYNKTRINGLNRSSLKNLMGQCHVQLVNNENTVADLISQQEAD